jgi:MFS family permease
LTASANSNGLSHTFRSLKNSNYRLFAISQLVSNCGSFIQITAFSWLVFQLGHSAFILGLVNFMRHVPLLFLGVFSGWLADNYERKKIVLWTNISMAVQALLLGVLTISGHVQLWHVIVLATGLGIASAIDFPARQSLIFNLVPRSDLVNAVSLNTSSLHASRAIGPLIAAFIVALFGTPAGEGTCFVINAASFALVIYTLMVIKLEPQSKPDTKQKASHAIKTAASFVWKTPHLRRILVLGAVSSVLCMQYLVLMPVFAKTVLTRDIGGFGWLMAGAGTGSFIAALNLAHRATGGVTMQRGVILAALGFAISLMAFSVSKDFYLSVALAVAIGFTSTTQLSASTSLIQLAVEDRLRGQVLSLWMMTIFGLGPYGSLLVGWLAATYGAPYTMAGCGLVAALFSLYYLLQKEPDRLSELERSMSSQPDQSLPSAQPTESLTDEAKPSEHNIAREPQPGEPAH